MSLPKKRLFIFFTKDVKIMKSSYFYNFKYFIFIAGVLFTQLIFVYSNKVAFNQ